MPFNGVNFPSNRLENQSCFRGTNREHRCRSIDRALSCAPNNTGRRAGGSLCQMELSRFNGLVFMPMSTERAAHVIGMKSR